MEENLKKIKDLFELKLEKSAQDLGSLLEITAYFLSEAPDPAILDEPFPNILLESYRKAAQINGLYESYIEIFGQNDSSDLRDAREGQKKSSLILDKYKRIFSDLIQEYQKSLKKLSKKMVGFMKPIITARSGMFEGDLNEKLRIYSPYFSKKSKLNGNLYYLFDEDTPYLIEIIEVPLIANMNLGMILSSYQAETNQYLINNFEAVGILTRPPDIHEDMHETLESIKRSVASEFEELVFRGRGQ